ncbi:ankyrin repeat containing protein [Hyaloscypha variabilis]
MALVLLGRDSSEKAKEQNSDKTLLDAVESGNEAVVRELLRRGNVSLRTKDSNGRTALHLAVAKDRRLIANFLLDKGADTEAVQNSGEKPLYLAAILGNQLMVELLVEFNANIEALNLKTRTTALHAAVSKRHIQVARFLLRHGANVDSRDQAGATPLCIAVRRGDLKSAEVLLQYGANKKIRLPEGGRTVEDLAAGDNSMIDMLNTAPLLEGPPILPPKVNGKFSLPVVEDEPNILKACFGFEATIVDFYIDDRERRIQVSSSVHELLYGRGPKEILSSERKSKMVGRQPDFRWYHLPANNMAWINDLVARHYLDRESGTALTQEDLEATLGFNIVAGRQTRASTAHSSFMRPVCKTIKPRSNLPRRRTADYSTDGDALLKDPQKQVDHIMLFVSRCHERLYCR